jgi:hypothetical protein
VRLSPHCTQAAIWPILQDRPRRYTIIGVRQSVEWGLSGETELLGGNPFQYHFAHHKSHMNWPETKPELPWWEAGDCVGRWDSWCIRQDSKESDRGQIEGLSRHFLHGLRKTAKTSLMIVGVRMKVRTERLPNARPEPLLQADSFVTPCRLIDVCRSFWSYMYINKPLPD